MIPGLQEHTTIGMHRGTAHQRRLVIAMENVDEVSNGQHTCTHTHWKMGLSVVNSNNSKLSHKDSSYKNKSFPVRNVGMKSTVGLKLLDLHVSVMGAVLTQFIFK